MGRARCSVCGAVADTKGHCCVKNRVSGLHSITNQVSFVVIREQITFRCSTNLFQAALISNPCMASSRYMLLCGALTYAEKFIGGEIPREDVDSARLSSNVAR